MRYSKQRELVLRTVEQLCDHPTAEEIFDKAAPGVPGPEPGHRLPQPEQSGGGRHGAPGVHSGQGGSF